MRVGIFHNKHNRKIYNRMHVNFMKGLKHVGLRHTESLDKPIDIAIFFNNNPESQKEQLKQLKRGVSVLTMYMGLFNQNGINDLQVRGQFADCTAPGDYIIYFELLKKDEFVHFPSRPDDRLKLFKNWGVQIPSEFKPKGDVVVIPQQVRPEGCATAYMSDWQQWFDRAWLDLKAYPVRIRRHPNRDVIPRVADKKNVTVTFQTSIDDDLKDAKALITLSSKTWLDALVRGIPFKLEDTRSPGVYLSNSYNTLLNAPQGNIQQWFENLAYCHWYESEIKSGKAITYIKEQL